MVKKDEGIRSISGDNDAIDKKEALLSPNWATPAPQPDQRG